MRFLHYYLPGGFDFMGQVLVIDTGLESSQSLAVNRLDYCFNPRISKICPENCLPWFQQAVGVKLFELLNQVFGLWLVTFFQYPLKRNKFSNFY